MNKAKSLKFPLQSEPCPLFFARQVKEIVEWAEILFWHSFIHRGMYPLAQQPVSLL